MKPLTIGNFDYTKDEKGEWVYKAKPSTPLVSGKPKYREQPQFKLQVEIEKQSKNRFMKIMNLSTIETVKFLKNNLV